MTENEIGKVVVDRAIRLHRELGPGFRADIIVEGKIILELKSVEKLSNAHMKQVLTYLKRSWAIC